MKESFDPKSVRSFFDAHWTVRKYKDVAMPQEHLDTILHAAQRAPTDATAQLYSFIRITDSELKQKLATLTTNAHLATASESFVICADMHRLNKILESGGHQPGVIPNISVHFAIGDAVMAAQNMLIAAEMLGYQGCWIGGVLNAVEEIVSLLEMPEGVFPFAAMTIGVPDEDPKHRPRLSRELVVHTNKYHSPTASDLEASISNMGAITARGNWIDTLARYWSSGGSMETREPHLGRVLDRQIIGRKT